MVLARNTSRIEIILILIQKTYQFINVVNGVSISHKTANIFFYLTQYHSLSTGMYIIRPEPTLSGLVTSLT